MTLNRTARMSAKPRKPLAQFSARRLAALAEQGITNPSSTFTTKTPKLAVRPAVKGAAKRPGSTDPDRMTVELVLERDHYSCSSCGDGIGDIRGLDWTIQHRVARGAGGTSRLELNMTGNLAVVCGGPTTPDGCHHRIEKRGSEDRINGFWILRDCGGKPTDPTEVPLYHALFGWCLLDNAGGYELISGMAA